MRIRTDEEAARSDVAALLADGRFADALVPAAVQAGRLGVSPRSLTFLAEIVRRGGAVFAARLQEPIPDHPHLVRPWLLAFANLPPGPASPPGLVSPPGPAVPSGAWEADVRLARWLDGVAMLVEARRGTVAFS
ncbi:hypothetical protein Q0Z83_061160 [Actinoplanes sichuanensis]|uniref:Uncharacterized protein n=1 Tax=Actinoplanes sichuanensis TaxID=512349 RepID=A0ABW3ZZW1_9ACTN|nr:hypothetical protein [Actinoplanes sichuanensis]BEL07925.1 hypothetical protein Q0Z83_061160 [Actinoplanes sichuanensis]